MIIAGVFVLAILAQLLRCLISQHRNKHSPTRIQPLEQRWWLFGFDIAFVLATWFSEGAVLQKTTAWIDRNLKARTFFVRLAGEGIIVVADGANARAVLNADDFEISSVRRQAFYPVVGDGMIATNGPQAAHGRKALAQTLTQKRLRDLAAYESHVQNLFAHLPGDASVVDLKEPMLLFIMDTLSEPIFGQSTSWLNERHLDLRGSVSRAFDHVLDIMRLRTDLGFLVHLHWDNNFHRSCKILHKFVESYIPKRAPKSSSVKVDDFGPHSTTIPLSYTQRLLDLGSDATSVRGHVLTTLIAGRDTTAALASFTLGELARHPEIQHKLRIAIAHLDSSGLCFSDLNQVSYLWWTIKEVLRLYPGAPANERAAKRDTYLPRGGGPSSEERAFVPAGSLVQIHTWAIHRDQSIWGEDANDFNPDRWQSGHPTTGFMPFGGGARVCPGQDFAMIVVAYTVVRVLQTYSRLESAQDEPFREMVTLGLSSYHGYKVRLHL